jgi:FkbM family methyltransferase
MRDQSPGGKRGMRQLERIKNWLRFQLYAPLRLNRFPSYYLSCSQFGEDMIVRNLLADVLTGFYVDIGAHHPVYYSNTYHFYRSGWRGINVDALPGSMEAFNLLRPRDINVEACVNVAPHQTREFFQFDSPALSTICPEEADRAVREAHGKIVNRLAIQTVTLSGLLDQYLLPGQSIDFLSIDVEGLDELILMAHDFTRYRPRVVVFERKGLDPLALGRDPLVTELCGRGYALVAVTGASVIMSATADRPHTDKASQASNAACAA